MSFPTLVNPFWFSPPSGAKKLIANPLIRGPRVVSYGGLTLNRHNNIGRDVVYAAYSSIADAMLGAPRDYVTGRIGTAGFAAGFPRVVALDRGLTISGTNAPNNAFVSTHVIEFTKYRQLTFLMWANWAPLSANGELMTGGGATGNIQVQPSGGASLWNIFFQGTSGAGSRLQRRYPVGANLSVMKHLAITMDCTVAGTANVRFYNNGQEQPITEVTNTWAATDTLPDTLLTFGAFNNGASNFNAFKISDFAIVNRVLSISEILSHMYHPKQIFNFPKGAPYL